MGNYAVRNSGLMQGWEIDVADLTFRGFTDEEIANKLWPERVDSGKLDACKQKLRRLRRTEKFQAYYRSIVTEWSVHYVGKALNKLGEQIDSDLPWLANKAANDILTQSKGVITGADDNTVVIKMEGMPELGTPSE